MIVHSKHIPVCSTLVDLMKVYSNLEVTSLASINNHVFENCTSVFNFHQTVK